MLFESLFAWACSVAVTTLESSVFHVGVQDLDLGVLPGLVRSKSSVGLESIMTDQALVRILFLVQLLLLQLFQMLIWMSLLDVGMEISQIPVCSVAVLASM